MTRLPAYSIGLRFDSASRKQYSYPDALAGKVGRLLPQFLGTIKVQNADDEHLKECLQKKITPFLCELGREQGWQTVNEISKHYQETICYSGLKVAAAHLRSHVELAWSLVKQKGLEINSAATLSCALARMLQKAGYHAEARSHIERIQSYCPLYDDPLILSSDTADEIRVVKLMLDQPAFGTGESIRHLVDATNVIQKTQNKAKFYWRQALDAILRGDSKSMNAIIENYRQMGCGELLTESNVALLKACAAIILHQGDPQKATWEYRDKQTSMLELFEDTPDGTIHGVLTSLYLEAIVGIHCGISDMNAFLNELNKFRVKVGINMNADGLREISAILKRNNIVNKEELPLQTEAKLTEILDRELYFTLHKLYAKLGVLGTRTQREMNK
ncbi:MAG TPA: hypothetical protein VGA94_05995 [Thermodesulfobacteriota bacterium]